MTTAEVFARYLGLTPANAPWAYGKRYFYDCRCGKDCYDTAHENDMPECSSCGNAMQYAYSATVLTATSPLAPEPTPGWLEVMVRQENSQGVVPSPRGGFKGMSKVSSPIRPHVEVVTATHPTHAVARALIAADLTLRSACERAADYNEKETNNEHA